MVNTFLDEPPPHHNEVPQPIYEDMAHNEGSPN